MNAFSFYANWNTQKCVISAIKYQQTNEKENKKKKRLINVQ